VSEDSEYSSDPVAVSLHFHSCFCNCSLHGKPLSYKKLLKVRLGIINKVVMVIKADTDINLAKNTKRAVHMNHT